MKAKKNQLIKEALELARRLTILADEAEPCANDPGCAVLCGVIRDCAYKVRQRAELEKQYHRQLGIWDTEQDLFEQTQAKTANQGRSIR
jgi:hypothetical protein